MKLTKTASGKYKLTKQAWKEIGRKAAWHTGELNVTAYIGDNTPVSVFFDYNEGQKEIINPADIAQPKIEPEVIINRVLIGDDDIKDALNSETLEKLKDYCWEKVDLKKEII
jgi:hypothetical protein